MFKTLVSSLDKKKTPSDSDIEKIPSYILCKWLAGNPGTILAANQINYYYNIPIKNQYYIVKNAFADKINFIQYPKNVSQDSLKSNEFVADYFNINIEKAKEYMELIDKDELKNIVNMYTERELKNKG